jgi:hypothetical protein
METYREVRNTTFAKGIAKATAMTKQARAEIDEADAEAAAAGVLNSAAATAVSTLGDGAITTTGLCSCPPCSGSASASASAGPELARTKQTRGEIDDANTDSTDAAAAGVLDAAAVSAVSILRSGATNGPLRS